MLEDLNLHERPDLPEYLTTLTDLFYLTQDKYIQLGDDAMTAKERAMEDVKSYILADQADE